MCDVLLSKGNCCTRRVSTLSAECKVVSSGAVGGVASKGRSEGRKRRRLSCRMKRGQKRLRAQISVLYLDAGHWISSFIFETFVVVHCGCTSVDLEVSSLRHCLGAISV